METISIAAIIDRFYTACGTEEGLEDKHIEDLTEVIATLHGKINFRKRRKVVVNVVATKTKRSKASKAQLAGQRGFTQFEEQEEEHIGNFNPNDYIKTYGRYTLQWDPTGPDYSVYVFKDRDLSELVDLEGTLQSTLISYKINDSEDVEVKYVSNTVKRRRPLLYSTTAYIVSLVVEFSMLYALFMFGGTPFAWAAIVVGLINTLLLVQGTAWRMNNYDLSIAVVEYKSEEIWPNK